MPRRPRNDKPGRLHHVLNRGQDRQRIFTCRADYRFFLSLLVRAVRARRIRVHAFCLMRNHFHMVLESVDGDISSTMQWIQGRYGGYFNGSHEHTGHAFTGRFHSFPVTSWTYLWFLVRYVDRNPLVAKRPVDPILFPWGSARHHVQPGPRPRWLARDLIDCFLMARMQRGEARDAAYREAFQILSSDRMGRAFVEARVDGASRARDELDNLLQASPEELELWLRRRSGRASGPTPPLAMLDDASIRRALAQARSESPQPEIHADCCPTRDPWATVEVGLLRDLAGRTYAEAAKDTGMPVSTAWSRVAAHRTAVEEGGAYLQLVATIAHEALRVAFGAEVRASIRAARRARGDDGSDLA